jgi:hypothetical protein
MIGRMTVIAPSGSASETQYTAEPPLEDLQKAVGGYIELVPFWNTIGTVGGARMRCIVFCNEDGKREPLPFNREATALWVEAIKADFHTGHAPMGDYLVGPVAILTGDEEFFDAMTSDADDDGE